MRQPRPLPPVGLASRAGATRRAGERPSRRACAAPTGTTWTRRCAGEDRRRTASPWRAPVADQRCGGALVQQGGATLQRHFVQCIDDQWDHSAWRVTRKGGRTVDRPDRAPHLVMRARRPRTRRPQPSCGRDAHAPAHSRSPRGDRNEFRSTFR